MRDEIEKRLAAARSGPWVAIPKDVPPDVTARENGLWHITDDAMSSTRVPVAIVDSHRDGHPPTREQAQDTAVLIANAPTDIRWLLDALDAATAREAKLRAGLHEIAQLRPPYPPDDPDSDGGSMFRLARQAVTIAQAALNA